MFYVVNYAGSSYGKDFFCDIQNHYQNLMNNDVTLYI
jgi:hypothetical protein